MEVAAERPQLPAAVPDGGGGLRGSSGCHGDQPDESGGGNGQAGGAGERGAEQGVPGPVSRESHSARTPQTLLFLFFPPPAFPFPPLSGCPSAWWLEVMVVGGDGGCHGYGW